VPTPLVIDTDPGIDDALAILLALASPEVDLRLVTTVHGNVELAQTTENALRVLHLAGRSDVPVAVGARSALVHPQLERAGHVHGTSGLGGVVLPPSPAAVDPRPAVTALADLLRSSPEPVTVAAIGPLTNIALLVSVYPEEAARIGRLVVMGGSATRGGNVTGAAEFNIWADPEAAAIVFGYGGALRVAGLHMTHDLQTTPERIDRLRRLPNRLGPLLAELLAFYAGTYVARHEDFEGAPVHDACAVLALTHPELFASRRAHIVVETKGEHTRGMTIVDQRSLRDRPAANADVLMEADDEATFAVITEAVASFA
jgi:pyrimidine-specific ribonucleoside hydrolase